MLVESEMQSLCQITLGETLTDLVSDFAQTYALHNKTCDDIAIVHDSTVQDNCSTQLPDLRPAFAVFGSHTSQVARICMWLHLWARLRLPACMPHMIAQIAIATMSCLCGTGKVQCCSSHTSHDCI